MENMQQNIIKFYNKGPYYEFSNFYPAKIIIDGIEWPTSEHYFQAQKFDDTPAAIAYKDLIRSADTPNKAFRLAKQKKSYGYATNTKISKTNNTTINDAIDKSIADGVKIVPNWDQHRIIVMRRVVLEKFRQNETLRTILTGTGDAIIIEDSPRDSYWGCGADGSGTNMLGKILMDTRAILAANARK